MIRILMVDDDTQILDGLQDILEDSGYEVLKAGRCAEAREKLAADPDLVIIDFNLPDGKGIDLAKEIRGARPGAKLFLMTGMSSADLAEPPDGKIVDAVVTKPVPVPELIALIQKHTARP